MRTFSWWFGMGALLTLAILMVQGGVRDLLYGSSSSGMWEDILSMGLTILGRRRVGWLRRGDLKPAAVEQRSCFLGIMEVPFGKGD